METGRDGAGDGRCDDDTDDVQGVWPTLPGPARLALATGSGLDDAAAGVFPQLPCLLTAERED